MERRLWVGTDDCFLFLAHAQRFYHLDVSAEPFKNARIHGVRRDAVRVDADDLARVRADGDFWQESQIHRHAEILE